MISLAVKSQPQQPRADLLNLHRIFKVQVLLFRLVFGFFAFSDFFFGKSGRAGPRSASSSSTRSWLAMVLWSLSCAPGAEETSL